MRRKATDKKPSDSGAQGNANINIEARGNGARRIPNKTPTGKGLGKAGAKRLGRLLKRAIQVEEPAAKGKLSLPKTPVRLFKHQIQTEEDSAHKTNTARTKPASHQISQLILSVVAQCKHRGGISMSELKQTLTAGGYNVTKDNRQVNVITKRLVHNETLVRTTRSATFRLNNKKLTDTTHVRMSTVKSPKPNAELKQSKTTSKSLKATKKSQKLKATSPKGKLHEPKSRTRQQAAKTHKPRDKPANRKPAGKSQKLTSKTHQQAGKLQKLTNKTCQPAGKSQKQTNKTRQPAGKSQKQSRKAPKATGKPSKPAGKKRRSVIHRCAQVRKTARKAQRTWRQQPKENQHLYKSSGRRLPPRRTLPKTNSRLKTQQRWINRRSPNYY